MTAVDPSRPPSRNDGVDGVALRTEGLSRSFGGVDAVQDVTLSIPVGARFGIIGPNGAGKTTLFNLLSGEIPPTSGRVELLGRDITRLAPHRRVARGLGRTYQITRVLRGMTVQENLAVAVYGLKRSKLALFRPWRTFSECVADVAELASSFGLDHRLSTLTDELSHGEVRQLEVCLALALKPAVLLLDEPAAGLSPAERVEIRTLLGGLPDSLTLVMIEHDMDVLRGVVDQVAVLHLGELVTQGSVGEVQRDETVRAIYLGTRQERQ